MALTNESYIVNTTTTGELIIPVKEQVSYLNIQLLGYQYYKYHEVMSQNLVHMVDDIKALKDGGLAQATFDLDALVAQSMKLIADEVKDLESGIAEKIRLQTDAAVTETKVSIAAFKLLIEGGLDANSQTVIGIVPEIQGLRAIIGDTGATFGLTKKIQTIYNTVGDSSSGLVQKVNSYEGFISTLNARSTADHSAITTLQGDVLGITPRLNSVEVAIGDTNTGILFDIQLNKDRIFGGGGYDGILATIGNVADTGMLHDIEILKTDLASEIISTDDRLDLIEPRLPALESSVSAFDNRLNTVSDNIGIDDNHGARSRIFVLEQYDIPAIKTLISENDTGHTDLIAAIRLELNQSKIDITTLEQSGQTNNEVLVSSLETANTTIATNTANITTNRNNLATLTSGQVATNTSDISSLNTKTDATNTNVSNMPSTIQNGILKDSDNIVYTSTLLKTIREVTETLTTANTIQQFETYFKKSGTYISESAIGQPAILAFINNSTTDGMQTKTNSFVTSYLNSHSYVLSDIATNKSSIINLNADVNTSGSVDYKINAAVNNIDSRIDILEGDANTVGSIQKTSKDGIDNLHSSLTSNEFATMNNKISANSTETALLKSKTKSEISEIQVEHARYDTILPFLNKMFKYVNSPGTLTDAQIDAVFNDIIGKVTTLSASIDIDHVVTLLPSNEFKIHIKLDRDIRFTRSTDANDIRKFAIIRRTSDGYRTSELFDETTTDSDGALSYLSGKFDGTIPSNIYDENGTAIQITDPAGLELVIGTIDIFGTYKEISTPIN